MAKHAREPRAPSLRQLPGRKLPQRRQLRRGHEARKHGGHDKQEYSRRLAEQAGGKRKQPLIDLRAEQRAAFKQAPDAGAKAAADAVGQTGGKLQKARLQTQKRPCERLRQLRQPPEKAHQLTEQRPAKKEQPRPERRVHRQHT